MAKKPEEIVPDYGMYTDEGNVLVDAIVMLSKRLKLNEDEVRDKLVALANQEGFEEADDTCVREIVLMTIFGE